MDLLNEKHHHQQQQQQRASLSPPSLSLQMHMVSEPFHTTHTHNTQYTQHTQHNAMPQPFPSHSHTLTYTHAHDPFTQYPSAPHNYSLTQPTHLIHHTQYPFPFTTQLYTQPSLTTPTPHSTLSHTPHTDTPHTHTTHTPPLQRALLVEKKKRRPTPYILFCTEQRPFLKQKYPDMSFTEQGKMFGKMWNALTDKQKSRYGTHPLAEKEGERERERETHGEGEEVRQGGAGLLFDGLHNNTENGSILGLGLPQNERQRESDEPPLDFSTYAARSSTPAEVQREKTKKKKRRTHGVVTPYIRFCAEQRPFLKAKYSTATFAELGKMFGRIWNQLTDAQKSRYVIPLPGERQRDGESDSERERDGEREKPKRQKVITPYIRFCTEQRPFLKQKYPDMSFTDAGKMFGRMWNALTDEQKAHYAVPREGM